jgi:hypothetical protein
MPWYTGGTNASASMGIMWKIICTKAVLLIIRVYIIWIHLCNERTCYLIYWTALVFSELHAETHAVLLVNCLLLSDFNHFLDVWADYTKNSAVSNFIKIHSAVLEFFFLHEEKHTGRHAEDKRIFATFRSERAENIVIYIYIYTLVHFLLYCANNEKVLHLGKWSLSSDFTVTDNEKCLSGYVTNELFQTVTLLNCVREVLDSNLSRDTDFLD